MKGPIFLFLVSLCLFSTKSKAQIIITGTVTDSAGNALQNVTVSAINAQTKAVKGFSITSKEGYFEIKLTPANGTLLRVSSIGYQTVEKNVIENVLNYNFKLKTGVYLLPEVRVKNQTLLKNRGDTLDYDVQQFARTQDRTIGDVIKNLPGITVSPTGAISYNGVPINKFYIDGADILGDKYAIGANTLPADAVNTVQVLENHQPIKMLEDRVFSENPALNIKLKSSAKLRVFGSGNIATGIPFNSTEARINTLSFKQKIKFVNTYSYNTIGGDLNSEVQSQNTNAPWQQQSNNTVTPLLGFTKLADPTLPARYFIDNNSHLISVNNLLPISKDKSLRLNLYWLPEQIVNDTKANNTFFIQPDTINQFENQMSKIKSSRLYFNATYLLNSKLKYLQNQLTLESSINKGHSNIENEQNTFTQNLKTDNTKFENSFLLKKVFGKEMYFEVTSNLKYYKISEDLNIDFGIYPWLLNNNTDYNQTSQYTTQELASHTTQIALSKTVKQFTASLKAEHFAESRNYESHLNLVQPNDEIKKSDSLFQNRLHWLQQTITLSPAVEYKNKSKRFQLSVSAPVLLRNIDYNNKISIIDTALSKISIHPSFRVNFELDNYSKVQLTASRKTDYTQPHNLLTGGILLNYRNLSQNLQSLQFSNAYSFSISYSYRDPVKIKFFNTALFYSRNKSPVITTQSFNLGLIQNEQELFSNTTQTALVFSNFSKYIFPLKTTLKLGYSATILNYYQIQNDLINNLRSVAHSTSLTIITKPIWYFNSELSINYITSLSKNLSQKAVIGERLNLLKTNFVSTFNFTEKTFVQAEVNHLFQQSNNDNTLLLADIRFTHTLSKTKTDIGIKAINIFNETRFIITHIDGLQVSTNDYWLRPFTLLLTATFRF